MEFDTYWQNGGYKKISDIIFAECHIFIVSNLCHRLDEVTNNDGASREIDNINELRCMPGRASNLLCVRNTTAKQYGSTIYKFCKEC